MSTAISSFSMDDDTSQLVRRQEGAWGTETTPEAVSVDRRAARASELVESGDGMTVPITEVWHRGDKPEVGATQTVGKAEEAQKARAVSSSLEAANRAIQEADRLSMPVVGEASSTKASVTGEEVAPDQTFTTVEEEAMKLARRMSIV